MKTLSTLFVLHLFAPPCLAGTGTPGTPPANLFSGIDWSRVYFDESRDGTLWVRGEHYKMSFDASGGTYYPCFGPKQPHHVPHRLSPDVVTLGGEAVTFANPAKARRSGDRVEFDRGLFVETYDPDPKNVEQSFTFPTLPRSGDLVLHIPVASELPSFEDLEGLRFEGEHGAVKYSRAVTLDARGRTLATSTTLEDGAIVIRVDAEDLASASMPLVVDPVVGDFWFENSSNVDTRNADVAWDPGTGNWAATYEWPATAGDIDVVVSGMTASGGVILGVFFDFSADNITHPRIANLASAGQFLVVAEDESTTPHFVLARTFGAATLSVGSLITVAPPGCSQCSPKIHPDVGGDSSSSASSCYCVVYEEDFPNEDKRIAYRLVQRDGTLVGPGPTYIGSSNSGFQPATNPSVSKSNGGNNWLLAWEQKGPNIQDFGDIRGALVHANGSVAAPDFGVSTGTGIDFEPSASSPLDVGGRAMVAFSRAVVETGGGFGHDTMIAALSGSTVLQKIDLSRTQNPNDGVEEIEPSIDSDGGHAVVAYSEFNTTTQRYDAYASDLYLSGSQIGITEGHVLLHPLALSERVPRITAQHATGGTSRRYLAVFDVETSTGGGDVLGELFDAGAGGTATPFCFGDGTGVACPCANNGSAGHGCANSVNSAGAHLGSTGEPSTLEDTFQLQASGMPSTASCIFIQGSSSIAGATYGDGIRCFSGTLVRLGLKTASNGLARFPTGADPKISVRGSVPAVGATRVYQAWYRNPPAFCTSATSNVTNGVSVAWAP